MIEVLTVEMPALLIPMHDAYHLRQVAQWREAFQAQPHQDASSVGRMKRERDMSLGYGTLSFCVL